jgi:hypothetical protein
MACGNTRTVFVTLLIFLLPFGQITQAQEVSNTTPEFDSREYVRTDGEIVREFSSRLNETYEPTSVGETR